VEVGADLTAVLELIGRAFGVDRAAICLAMAGALGYETHELAEY
jgi:hypothetical protein